MTSITKVKRQIEILKTKRQTQGLDTDELTELHNCFRTIANLAATKKLLVDECEALANLCMLLVDDNPREVIELADRFFALNLSSNEWLQMHVEDALAVAYNHLSEEISAMQHRARAIELSNKLNCDADAESTVSWWKLRAAFRYADTRLPSGEQYVVRLRDDQSMEEWLSEKAEIGVRDISPTFGSFVTNDRQFYREAVDRVRMLSDRLKNNLSKPDNYLLIADPGSGKSFFVSNLSRNSRNYSVNK